MILSQLDYTELNITEAGAESTFDKSTINTEANLHWVHIPSHDKPVRFQVMNSFPALNIPDVENEKRLQLGNIGTTQFGPRPGKQPPHYFVESLRLDKDWELLVTGMDWLEDGRLAVCTWPGDVFLLSGVTSGMTSGCEAVVRLERADGTARSRWQTVRFTKTGANRNKF